jgi:hypothetical protein
MDKVIVYKNRSNTIIIDLGFDISGETYSSQIRSEPKQDAPLLADWQVAFFSDGTDGKLRLILTQLITGQISADSGYMDLKRVTGGVALAVFNEALKVEFRGTVTA